MCAHILLYLVSCSNIILKFKNTVCPQQKTTENNVCFMLVNYSDYFDMHDFFAHNFSYGIDRLLLIQ